MLDYIKVARIGHWLKNIFVVLGHLIAIVLFFDLTISADLMLKAALSLIPVCLIASANYILNEILDAPFDLAHPVKKYRPVPAGKVNLAILWTMQVALILVGFGLAFLWFKNPGYWVALTLLFISGLVYNISPVRLKDRAFMDVIAESFNNPIRLWLGWYALVPVVTLPPLSITLAWWCIGGLLMTGKRYAEFRFINDTEVCGRYRRSFQIYTDRSLKNAMSIYTVGFVATSIWTLIEIESIRPLGWLLPIVIGALVIYFREAWFREGAQLEPEKMLRNPAVICVSMAVFAVGLILLVHADYQSVVTQAKVYESILTPEMTLPTPVSLKVGP